MLRLDCAIIINLSYLEGTGVKGRGQKSSLKSTPRHYYDLAHVLIAKCVFQVDCATRIAACADKAHRPVCGTDNQTYPTRCQLLRTHCRDDGPNLVAVKHRGHCKGNLSLNTNNLDIFIICSLLIVHRPTMLSRITIKNKSLERFYLYRSNVNKTVIIYSS